MAIVLKILRITTHLLLVFTLSLLTQVGGVIYLIALLFLPRIAHNQPRFWLRLLWRAGAFLAFYSVFTFVLVPPLARLGGRVPMQMSGAHLRPHNFLTCFMNRQYVHPELRAVALEVAERMAADFPGTVTLYLDAGHPFWDGYPLLPHLSHSDGKKLDLAFFWKNAQSGAPVTGTPSAIGYGVYVDPGQGEERTAEICAQKGYWQYGYLEKWVPQNHKKNFALDEIRTRAMTKLFCKHPAVGKVFIEPYLKRRLGLQDMDKIRFHGCQAIRHDDHLHVQLR